MSARAGGTAPSPGAGPLTLAAVALVGCVAVEGATQIARRRRDHGHVSIADAFPVPGTPIVDRFSTAAHDASGSGQAAAPDPVSQSLLPLLPSVLAALLPANEPPLELELPFIVAPRVGVGAPFVVAPRVFVDRRVASASSFAAVSRLAAAPTRATPEAAHSPHPSTPLTASTRTTADAVAPPVRRRSSTPRHPLVRFAVWLPAVLCLLVAAGLGAWILSGGHVLVVQTPSMGTAAPVGSLVLTHSVADAQLHRGMIIAFRVPSTHAVYLHRIAQILPGGRIRTRGDLNGADDGWVLTRSAIVGLPALIMPGIGWLLLAAPWALGALMLGGFLAIILPRALRPSIRAITIGAAVSLPLYLLRPFSRVAVVDTVRTSHGFVARLVNAGLFPLRVTLRSSSIVLAPAHAGNITAQLAGHSTSLLAATVLIPLWGWMLFAAFVLAPLAVSTFALKTEPPLPASVRRPGKLRKRLVAWLEGRPHQPLAGVGSP